MTTVTRRRVTAKVYSNPSLLEQLRPELEAIRSRGRQFLTSTVREDAWMGPNLKKGTQ